MVRGGGRRSRLAKTAQRRAGHVVERISGAREIARRPSRQLTVQALPFSVKPVGAPVLPVWFA
jgi:hypothetical protein